MVHFDITYNETDSHERLLPPSSSKNLKTRKRTPVSEPKSFEGNLPSQGVFEFRYETNITPTKNDRQYQSKNQPFLKLCAIVIPIAEPPQL